MEREPAGRVAVVTGGGRGIGRAIGERLARCGAQVVAAARSNAELAETRRGIEAAGGKCHVRVTDVADAGQVAALVEETVARFQRLDVLVNCAGVAPLAPIEALDPATFRGLQAVNVDAVYLACRAAWPIMKQQGGGVIVNLSSVASADPFPGFTAYGASKAWINAWTRGLADEGRTCGIRVYAVAPGAVETRMLREVFPDFPAARTLQPSDVADMVYALTRPECRYATGQTIFVRA